MLPNFSWRDFVREITIESQIFIRFFSIDRMSKSFFFQNLCSRYFLIFNFLVKFRGRERERNWKLWKSSNFSDKASQGKSRISVLRKNKFEFLKNLIKLVPINRRTTISSLQFGSQVKLDFLETFYFSFLGARW